MSAATTVPLGDLMQRKSGSVDPLRFPDEIFDLYSVPAFDSGKPDVIAGRAIGSAKQIVQPGDVLLSKIVPHIRRSWVVGKNRGRRMIASGEWIVFRNDKIHADYLRHVLVGNHFHARFMQTVSGVGGSLLRARPSYVAEIEIPLPPLLEQQRIAEQLGQADQLCHTRRYAVDLSDNFLPAAFLEFFGDPVCNPMGWETASLEDICVDGTGIKAGPFGSSLKKEYYSKSGIRVYGQEQVIGGDFRIGDYYISEEMFPDFAAYEVRPGDLLISLVGSFGKVIVVPEGIERGIINPRLLKVSPKPECIKAVFVAKLIEHPLVQRELLKMSHGGTMGILNASLLRALRVIVPPLSLQQQFTALVARHEHLRATHREALRQAEHLFQILLHRAFNGGA